MSTIKIHNCVDCGCEIRTKQASRCRTCGNKFYHAQNPRTEEQILESIRLRKEYKKRYFQENKDRIRERKKKPSKEKSAEYNMRWHYGVEIEDFNRVLLEQNGLCAICSIKLDRSNRSTVPSIDHDHRDGSFRGILCHRCNVSLGLMDENPETLRSAIRYLESTNGKKTCINTTDNKT